MNRWALAVFALLLAATGLMRLVELRVSARRAGRRRDDVVREPWLFPLMALLHLGLVFAPLFEVLWLERRFRPALGAAAVTVLALATALRIWTLRSLGGSWNVLVLPPVNAGVVTHGPYAWIRHPNYLAVILEVAALPLFHGAWIASLTLSLLNACVLSRRIRTEEAALMKLPAWRDAMAGRARLVPGLF